MAHVIETYELSPMQAGMLFHAVSGGDPGIDIEQVVATLHEPLDEVWFLRAWQCVVDRHPVLHSCFRWDGVAEPVQDVVDRVQIPVERFDWRALAEADRYQQFQDLLDHDRDRGFDLSRAPLMRLALVRAAEREHWVLWTFHHGILDGRSYPLVLREVFAFYEAFSRGEDADLPLPRPYRDHIEWLRKLDHGAAKSYWQSVLSGFRAPTPLGVALDREAEHVTGRVWGAHEIRLPATLTTALKERAREASVTLNNLLQGAWALLLHRYSGESDIVFGATRACRRSAVSGADDMVGLFINTLPMRVRIDPEARLVPWLQQLRAQQVGLREYEHTPLAKVQAWSDVPGGMPLFESILVFENQTLDAQLRALGETWSERRFLNFGQAGFPLALIAWGDDELVLHLDYSRRRFAHDVIGRTLGHLQTLLEGMAAHPQARLRDLPLLTTAERHQLTVEWQGMDADDSTGELLHTLFEAQVERSPEAVAVVYEEQRLTYGELNGRANQLAHYLIKLGVGPDILVGICMERSVEMLVALFGVLKAGGAYVPLDPGYPKERLAFMLEDTHASVLLTRSELLSRLPEMSSDGRPATNDGRERSPVVGPGSIICLDRDREGIGKESEENPDTKTTTENLVYVIYTSGSTGRPKGVEITHRALTNFVASACALFALAPGDRVLQFASVSFDTAAEEIYASLMCGARLVLRTDGMLESVSSFLQRCADWGVTVLDLPTAYWHELAEQMVRESLALPGGLRLVIIGGERAVPERLAQWREAVGDQVRLLNAYGPTEATVAATTWELNGAAAGLAREVPIGRPIANVQTYVLDRQSNPVPIGVCGELHIGGVSLARGYLNRPDLTAEKFIPDPFRGECGRRLYKTGDLVRYLSDGNLEFLGRIDQQVKNRGFRVELGEIEAVLAEHSAVRQAAVHLWQVQANDVRIVACCVPANAGALAPISLRKHLRARLPEYMIPQYFLLVEQIPLTPNGKIDRNKLPTPVFTESPIGQHEAPSDPVETAIAEIWTNLIGPARSIGRADKFFEMGGHSLLALQALRQIENKLGVRLDLHVLFQESLAEIATRCRSEPFLGGRGNQETRKRLWH